MGSVFRFDFESLRGFRIGLGLLLLIDCVHRLIYVKSHYSDYGILPRHVLIEFGNDLHWSLHVVHGSVTFQVLLFLVAMIAGFAVLVGFRTRLALLISWLLLISLNNRNPLVLNSGDDLLRMMTFWAIFLPLDSSTQKGRGGFVGLGSIAFFVQLVLLYSVGALLKNHAQWGQEGTALQYALNLNVLVTDFGRGLLGYPEFLRGSTQAIWWVELVAPLLLFLPLSFRLRPLLVALFVGFHLAIFLCFRIGLFPWICILCWLAILPGSFWQRPLARVEPLLSRIKSPLGQGASRLSPFDRYVVGAILALTVMTNIQSVFPFSDTFAISVRPALEVMRFDQKWNMFAPRPTESDHWFVPEATRFDQKIVNARTNEPIDFNNLAEIKSSHWHQRWRKYTLHLASEGHQQYYQALAKYYCREGQEHLRTEQRFVSVTLWHLKEPTQLNGSAQLQRQRVSAVNCFGSTD